jgi:hypothetical protein
MMIDHDSMTERIAEKSEDTRSKGEGVIVRPPPEPIYDLTTSDKTELLKAAGQREREEE